MIKTKNCTVRSVGGGGSCTGLRAPTMPCYARYRSITVIKSGNFSSDSPLCLLFASSKPPLWVLGTRGGKEEAKRTQRGSKEEASEYEQGISPGISDLVTGSDQALSCLFLLDNRLLFVIWGCCRISFRQRARAGACRPVMEACGQIALQEAERAIGWGIRAGNCSPIILPRYSVKYF